MNNILFVTWQKLSSRLLRVFTSSWDNNTQLHSSVEACLPTTSKRLASFSVFTCVLLISASGLLGSSAALAEDIDGLTYKLEEANNNVEYYSDNVSDIIQDNCLGCHGGTKGNLNGFASTSTTGFIQSNYTVLADYIASGYGDTLLSKVNGISHGGGKIFELDSTEYKALADFVELENDSDTNETGTAKVLGRSTGSDEKDIEIPDEVTKEGVTYNVTQVDGLYQSQLTSVSIGKNVKTIGDYALAENKLTSVIIPANVTTIESLAFNSNELTKVMFLGDYSTQFNENIFTGNSDLTKIEACQGSEGWENVTFNNSTDDIEVTLVACGDDVDIDGLKYELVEAIDNVEYYSDNVSDIIQDSCLSCHGVKKGNLNGFASTSTTDFIQSNYTVLADYIASGYGDKLLSKVNGISHGGGKIFELDSTEYKALAEFVELQGNSNADASATVVGITSEYEETDIDIPDSVEINGTVYPVTIIKDKAFQNAPITSVTIGDNVISIGVSAFNGASSLRSVSLGSSLVSVGTSAFCGTNLSSVSFPKNVTSIGNNAFCDIDSVIFLGDYSSDFHPYAFYGKPDLSLEACNGSTSWNDVSFLTASTGSGQVDVKVSCNKSTSSGLPLWLLKAAKDAQEILEDP